MHNGVILLRRPSFNVKFQNLLHWNVSHTVSPRPNSHTIAGKRLTRKYTKSTRGLTVMSSRRGPLTHFLCIPLVNEVSRPQLEAAMNQFRSVISEGVHPEAPPTIPQEAIRPLGSIHLTLGVMSLPDPRQITDAIQLLKTLDLATMLQSSLRASAERDKDISSGRSSRNTNAAAGDLQQNTHPAPLTLTLKGLASMHSLSKASILYAKPVDADRRVQRFCEMLRDAFLTAGLLRLEDRPLLLHATIVNTTYVPKRLLRNFQAAATGGQTSRNNNRSRQRLTIDATEVVGKVQDLEWMKDVRLESVAICRMGAQKVRDENGQETGDEEYIAVADVQLP